jgi:hypothetical protein
MDYKLYWNNFKDFLEKLWKAIKNGGIKILFTLIGNFFPIYFGYGILYFLPSKILSEDANFDNLFKPVALIVYSATFFISAIFLWFKNLESKQYVTLIVFFIFYMSISGLFVLSYIKDIKNQDFYLVVCKAICWLSIGIYVFQEIKNSYYEVNNNFQDYRDDDFQNLRNNFRPKN